MKVFLLFPLFVLLLNPAKPPTVIRCAPAAVDFRATISTVQSGNWSNPATWGGRLPSATDAPIISAGHTVFVDTGATIAGMQVAGTLSFDATKSETITSTQNILITGLLEMLSPRPSVVHTIRFIGINETKMVGGGEDVMASDIGLWVMGSGQLNLKGADKTSWTNALDDIGLYASIGLKSTDGWQPGDEVAITPTAAGSFIFDEASIKSISGQSVVLTSLKTLHPKVNNKWTAEVMNLTRNVRIEGTSAGKSHLFIRSSKPQFIRNVQFRYLGPRKQQPLKQTSFRRTSCPFVILKIESFLILYI